MEVAVYVPVVGGDGRVQYVPLRRASEAGPSPKADVSRVVGPRDEAHAPADSQPDDHEPAPSSKNDPYDSGYGTEAIAPGEDAYPVLELRGGGGDSDIIDDWESVSALRYRRRSSALQEIDRAVRQWRAGGYQEPELLEQNEYELRAILEAIGKWRDIKTGGSRRIDAINQLQQRVTEELQDISDTLAIDSEALQAFEPAALDSGDAGNRQDGNRPATASSQRWPVMPLTAADWEAEHVAGYGWRPVSAEEMRLFEQHVGPANGRRLLDVGCGDGGYAAELHRLGFGVVGVDYAPTGIDTALERHGGLDGLDFAVLDIDRDDPTALGRFDVITCRMVYAFLDRPRFLATVRRLLNAGGVLHITTPHADRSHMPGNKPGIGIGEQDIAALCDGWATWSRYDIDYLACIVCKLPASPHPRSGNADGHVAAAFTPQGAVPGEPLLRLRGGGGDSGDDIAGGRTGSSLRQTRRPARYERTRASRPAEGPRRGGPMAVASHAADDEANVSAGVSAQATQQMVPGTRDLRVARWLVSNNAEQAQSEAQSELARLLRGVDRALSDRRTDLGRTLQQQADSLEADLRIYFEMRRRSPQTWTRLNEAQAAALVVVERRGRLYAERDHQAALRRLRHEEWAEPYAALDAERLLQAVHEHLRRGMRLTTNILVQELDSLLADPQARYRNYWETGTTREAGVPLSRIEVEEGFGYAATLGRSRGQNGPAVRDRPLLPKYAALTSPLRPDGLSQWYGDVVMVWKQQVKARTTFTPQDSLDARGVHGVRSATGPDHLYPLLAYGEEAEVRLAFAEATGFAYDPELAGLLTTGEPAQGYFEAQIHGDLTWSDLDAIVICYPPGHGGAAEGHRRRILAYAREHGNAGLRVELYRKGDPIPGLPVATPSVRAYPVLIGDPPPNDIDRHAPAAQPRPNATDRPHDTASHPQAFRHDQAEEPGSTETAGAGVQADAVPSGRYSTKVPYAPQQDLRTYEQPPPGFIPVFTQSVFRHGSRADTSSKYGDRILRLWDLAADEGALTSDGAEFGPQVRSLLNTMARIGYGNLSGRGKRELQGAAARMRKRLPELFTRIAANSERIDVVNSGKGRTIESGDIVAAALAAGDPALEPLIGPARSDRDLLHFHKAAAGAEYQAYRKSDVRLAAQLQANREQPAIRQAARSVLLKIFAPAFVDRIFAGEFSSIGAGTGVDTAQAVYRLYTFAPLMSHEGTWDLERYVTARDASWFAYLNDANTFYEKGPGFADSDITYKMANVLLDDFFAKLEAKRAGTSDLGAELRFAHAEVIMPFAVLLGLPGSQKPASLARPDAEADAPWRGELVCPMAANIQWDMFHDGATYLVRMLYNEKETAFPSAVKPVSEGSMFYELDELRRYYGRTASPRRPHDDNEGSPSRRDPRDTTGDLPAEITGSPLGNSVAKQIPWSESSYCNGETCVSVAVVPGAMAGR